MKSLKTMLLALILCLPFFGMAEVVPLTLLHTNDLHAHLLPDENGKGGAAAISAYLKAVKADCENLLILDAGDLVTGTPVSTLFAGTPVFEVYNTMPYDAVVLGNHEFDHGWGHVARFLEIARFPVLSANIRLPEGRLITGQAAKRFQIGILTVDVVGLTAPGLDQLTAPRGWQGLKIEQAAPALKAYLAGLQSQPDLLIVLSHLGVSDDEALAEAVPEIDIIVGGHSHTVLQEARRVGDTLIVQAGSYGRYIGQMELWVDSTRDAITASKSWLVPVDASVYGEDPETAEVVERWEGRVRDQVDVQIGTNPTPKDREALRRIISEILKQTYRADFGYQNPGGTRADLPSGPILKRHIWTMLPFDNTAAVMTVQRNQLKILDLAAPAGDARETFTVATNSYIAEKARVQYHLPAEQIDMREDVLRELVIDYVQKQGNLEMPSAMEEGKKGPGVTEEQSEKK